MELLLLFKLVILFLDYFPFYKIPTNFNTTNMYVYHLRWTKPKIIYPENKTVNFSFNFYNENQVLGNMIFTNNFRQL